jgi:hypothetical protein
MTVFDLLFIGLFLTTVASLLLMLFLFANGRGDGAWRLARYLSAGWLAYMTLVVAVSTSVPQRVLHAGEARCFDDWCITVLGAEPAGAAHLKVRVTISSRARRAVQRESGIRLSLLDESGLDESGRRRGTLAACSPVSLDARLEPGEARETNCLFDFRGETRRVSLVIGHADGFPIRWFIIGEEAWFRKPTVVYLPV